MSQENTAKNMIVKIVVTGAILLVVAGIWFVKNAPPPDPAQPPSPEQASDTDFALDVTGEIDFEQLTSYGLPILIDFGAEWCPPCQAMAPVLEELNEELRGRAVIKYVDVDKYPALASQYPAYSLPTQVLFDANGEPFRPPDPQAVRLNLYALKDTEEHVLTTHTGLLTKDDMLALLTAMGME